MDMVDFNPIEESEEDHNLQDYLDRPGARTAAGGPGGRLRANRTGACADQYSKQ